MAQNQSEKIVISSFTSAQWDSCNLPKPVNVIARFRGKRLWAGIIAFVVLCNLGVFGTVVIALGVIGLVIAMVRSAGKPSPQQAFVGDLLAELNETMVELTGDADARLSGKDLAAMRDSDRDIPLPVNGVSGLNLRVVSDRPGGERIAAIARTDDRVRTTKVIVTATAPDYGTASFDRLLQATLDAG